MKMTFTLKIELGNEAMQTGTDIANALRELANHIDDPNQHFDDPTDESGFDRNGRIRDLNGNTTGTWKVA
jgi:hypothetical protein